MTYKMKPFFKTVVLSCCLMILCGRLTAQEYSFQNIIKGAIKETKQLKQDLKKSMINYANRHKSRIENRQRIYELRIQDLITVDLPDKETCMDGIDLLRDECSKYVKQILNRLPKAEGVTNITIPPIPSMPTRQELLNSKACQCIQKHNPHYQQNDTIPADKLQRSETGSKSLSLSSEAISAESQLPSRMYIKNDQDVANEGKTKKLTESNIRNITEKCLRGGTYEFLCDCFRFNYKSEIGQLRLWRKPDEPTINEEIKEYNEFLQQVSKISTDIQQELKYTDMAKLANNVYNPSETVEGGWELITAENSKNIDKPIIKLLTDYNNPEGLGISPYDGFHAQIYYNDKTKEYVLSFRGSESPNEDVLDWVTNYSQATGSNDYRKQYTKAKLLAKSLQNRCKGCKISITGHSLGGGLASAAGVETGLPTYTFNAAGLHRNTIDEFDNKVNNSNIKAYYSNDDPLNQLQDKRYYDFVKANIKTSSAIVFAEIGGEGTVQKMVAESMKEASKAKSQTGALYRAGTGALAGAKQSEAETTVRAATRAAGGVMTGKIIESVDNFANSESETTIGEILRNMGGAAVEAVINGIASKLGEIIELYNLPSALGERINIGATGQGHSMDGIETKVKKENEIFARNIALQEQLPDCKITNL
jgi:hypothetical protein